MTGSPFVDRFVTVSDGLRLHLRDYEGAADKLPLLCLHGLTRNARDFADLAERYSPGRRVLALEFRGRGQSDFDPQPERYTPLTYARDVIEVLDQLGIGEAIFVGTSLGGLVTMTVGAFAPQLIAATVLNDIGPELSEAGLERIRNYVGKEQHFASWEAAADAIADNNGHLPKSFTAADWLKMAKRTCREDDGAIVYDYDMAIAQPFHTQGPAPTIDLWPLFATLATKPLLVVRGEVSDLLSSEALAKMQAAAPDMESVTVRGVPHAPTLDEPEVVAAIDRFLGKLQ